MEKSLRNPEHQIMDSGPENRFNPSNNKENNPIQVFYIEPYLVVRNWV